MTLETWAPLEFSVSGTVTGLTGCPDPDPSDKPTVWPDKPSEPPSATETQAILTTAQKRYIETFKSLRLLK